MLQSQLHHKFIDSPNLKYQSYNSPTSTDILWGAGQNVLTSAIGYAELRPGFSALEPTPTTFSGTLKRIFGWRRWAGNFYVMLCEIDTVAKVYKLTSGVDASFSLIFTSTSAEPFDFVVSNNFCFFGNGKDMQKFDGTTVTNWGISIGSFNNFLGPNIAGAGANDSSAGVSWTNPGNVSSASNFATAVLAPGKTTKFLQATTFSFLVPPTATITGIRVDFEYFATRSIPLSIVSGSMQLLKSGNPIGTAKSFGQFPSAVTSGHAGADSDLWGTSWTYSDTDKTIFGIQFSADASGGNPSPETASIRNVRITIYGIGGANVVVSGSAGTMSATVGYKYVFCYGNSGTGHLSSPCPASASTGVFTNKLGVLVSLTASTDPQVNQIRLFRTTDGSDGKFFEVLGSPYPNVTGAITDSTDDTALSTITAPTPGFNDPPPPSKGFVWYANRIWMFTGNLVWMTGWEEINNGVGEECVPSGGAGNFWAFASEVIGLSRTDDGVYVFTAEAIYKISGDSLDTFYRGTYADNLGARQRAAICRLGKITAWLDSSNSVWGTNANTIEEIATPIRPDISAIDHSASAMTFYINKTYRWMTLMDGGRLFNFDLDGQQWMPPWTVSANSIASCETSSGIWDLLIGSSGGRVLKLNPAVFSDDAAGYSSTLTSNLFNLTPAETQPDRMGTLEYLSIENNGVDPSKVEYLIDENPAVAAMTDITASKIDVPLRTQGTSIRNVQYGIRKPPGRRCSFRLTWNASSPYWRLYTFDLAMQEFGK